MRDLERSASKHSPALAILVGQALHKGGMKGAKGSDESEEKPSYDSPEEADQHLQEICDDMMQAIHAKDSEALKDLLKEAFECLEAEPHDEEEGSDSY